MQNFEKLIIELFKGLKKHVILYMLMVLSKKYHYFSINFSIIYLFFYQISVFVMRLFLFKCSFNSNMSAYVK